MKNLPTYANPCGCSSQHNITYLVSYTYYPLSSPLCTVSEEHNARISSLCSRSHIANAASTIKSIIFSCFSRSSFFSFAAESSLDSWYSPRMFREHSNRYLTGMLNGPCLCFLTWAAHGVRYLSCTGTFSLNGCAWSVCEA